MSEHPFLLIAAMIVFAYFIGYARGRWSEAKMHLTPAELKRLDDEITHEQRIW